MRTPCAFASDAWLTIPFLKQPKLPIDELVDVLLYLPHCLTIETQLKGLAADDVSLRQRLKKKLAELLQRPINSLSAWWSTHQAPMMKHDGIPSSSGFPTLGTSPSPDSFTSPLAATSVAYYCSAQAIATCLSDLAAPFKQCDELLVRYISFILSAVEYHRACGQYSGGTFMMIYPIKVALFRSPCPHQKEELRKALLDWGRERGVEGVCTSGAPLWHQPGRVSLRVATE
jgi:hypothetical protein